jgi:hypothetical protein
MPNENLTPLSPDKAYALASRLTLIPGFPNRDQAIRAVAEWLMETCTVRAVSGSVPEEHLAVLQRAEWLVNQAVADRMHGAPWGGIHELKTRYDAKYHPGLPLWNQPAKEKCPQCWDTGIVNYGDTPASWCCCPWGQIRRLDEPSAVDNLNANSRTPRAGKSRDLPIEKKTEQSRPVRQSGAGER